MNRYAAIARLRATQISPLRWAYWAEETREWWIVTRAELDELGGMIASGDPDAYSLWCAHTGRLATPAEARRLTGR